MNKLIFIFLFGVLFLTACGSTNYDDFAKCLTEKGATMYGSYQCSHCLELKEDLGSSFQYVNYVECGPLTGPINPVCTKENIEGFPTWKFKDGSTIAGYKQGETFKQFAEKTGCTLP